MAPLLVGLALLLPIRVPGVVMTHPGRAWVRVYGGVQAVGPAFTDTAGVPLNLEATRVTTRYPGGNGAFVSGAAGFRVWKRLSIGTAVSWMERRGTAAVDADVPHPFFFQTPRHVQGRTAAARREVGVHVKGAWTLDLSPRLQLLLSAGPSWIVARQTLVTDVRVSESYPFDTAIFASAVSREVSRGGLGAHAAADASWRLSRHLGAGLLVQATRARPAAVIGGRSVPLRAGGVQAGGGLRLTF